MIKVISMITGLHEEQKEVVSIFFFSLLAERDEAAQRWKKNFAGMGRVSEGETKRPIHDGQMRHNSRRPLTDRPTAITTPPPPAPP